MEGDIALRGIRRDRLVSQKFLSMLSKIIAVPGTFFDLGLGFDNQARIRAISAVATSSIRLLIAAAPVPRSHDSMY